MIFLSSAQLNNNNYFQNIGSMTCSLINPPTCLINMEFTFRKTCYMLITMFATCVCNSFSHFCSLATPRLRKVVR